MPTISINRDLLFQYLGRTYTEEEFDELCFEFGLELDEVTTERQIIAKEQGADKSKDASEEIIFKIEIPANRYDLLCIEGLTRALLIFQGKIEIPQYRGIKPSTGLQQLIVLPNTMQIRPFGVAAILRNVTFTKEIYNSFIDLQDKLHQNLCRKRSIVAIGTHDLDTIKGPFYYDAKVPNDIKFKPLNQTKEYTATELMDLYSTDSHLKPYLPIIRDSVVYPVIYDSNGVILSMPPIINGEHSKINLNTKNVFIEMTATDEHKAKMVLDTLVCMFSEYCFDKFTVEMVEVTRSDTERLELPELKYREEEISVDYINTCVGINESADKLAKLLTKMSLKAEPFEKQINKKEKKPYLKVTIPPTRQDILHGCDIAEDVGVAFGFNKIPIQFPQVVTIGQQLYLSKVTDQLRNEIARCGYTEALTFALCSREDIGYKMLQNTLLNAVHIANPKTIEFQVARTSLIPGLLKTLNSNKKMPLPLKLFEISDVILKDNSKDSGASNERRLAAVYYNKTPGFEIIHGLLDRIMQVLDIHYSPTKSNDGYFIRAIDDPRFLSKRCAEVVVKGKVIGTMGVLHPQIIENFELIQPCSAIEINIQNFEI